jgi:hypothetical protein
MNLQRTPEQSKRHIHTYIHTHTYVCIHTYIRLYTCIHAYIHTYIHTDAARSAEEAAFEKDAEALLAKLWEDDPIEKMIKDFNMPVQDRQDMIGDVSMRLEYVCAYVCLCVYV